MPPAVRRGLIGMDEEQRKALGERVRDVRKARGWSQERLAEEAGVTPNTVLAIEKGTRQTQPGKLTRVLTTLGMETPPDDSLSLDGVPEDVRVFLSVVAARLKVLDENERALILSRVYPLLIQGTGHV